MPARCRIDLTEREVKALRASIAHSTDTDNNADDVALYRIDEKAERAAEKFQNNDEGRQQ